MINEKMEVIQIDIEKEISGDLYCKVLDFAVGRFPLFLFAVDWKFRFSDNEHIRKIVEELTPFLVKRFHSNKWPGTEILMGQIEVFHYNLTNESTSILKKYASSFYQWDQWEASDLPKDLCIMRNAEQPWLCNIAHEKIVQIFVTLEEKLDLLNSIPELTDYFGEEGKPIAYYV